MVCCAMSNKNKLKVQQNKATKATKEKATKTEKWLFMVGAQLPTPVIVGKRSTGCRWSTRIQIGLSVNHIPEYLRGRSPNDHFRKNVPFTNSAGEKE